MNAKFSEGEVVILQSVNYPEYSGEYEIFKILGQGEEWEDRIDSEVILVCDDYIGYIFTTPLPSKDQDHSGECLWAESSLRKRQEPSELSYTEIMQTLRSPIYEVN